MILINGLPVLPQYISASLHDALETANYKKEKKLVIPAFSLNAFTSYTFKLTF